MSYRPILVLLCGAFALAGCGEPEGLAVSRLEVVRHGWDSASVRVAFEHRARWGDARDAEPPRLDVRLYDAEYSLLHEGSALEVPIPDARLGDREPLMLEVCGGEGDARTCAQQGLLASPKRVRRVRASAVRWPLDDAYRIGSYDLGLQLERRQPGGSGWEPLAPSADMRAFLVARVDSAASHSPLRVPVEPGRGRFDLKRERGFDAFRYALEDRLFEGRDAGVHFDVIADLRGQSWTVDSVATRIEAKTDADRLAEVEALAADAARVVLERLSSFYGERDARMYIDEWRWDRLSDRYEIELTVYWRGGFADRGRYRLSGRLVVGDDGSGGRFEATDGNFRALRRWQARVQGDDLALPRLDASGEEDDEAAEPAAR